MDSMFFQDRALAGLIAPYHVDGVVFHGIKSCRTTSTGLSDTRRVLTEQFDIPSLLLESDMMDRRVVSEAQMKNRVDAFFEGLASRKLATSPA
jgi:benzoyl-CoA reductase subunit B